MRDQEGSEGIRRDQEGSEGIRRDQKGSGGIAEVQKRIRCTQKRLRGNLEGSGGRDATCRRRRARVHRAEIDGDRAEIGGDRGKTTPAVEGEPEAEQLWLRQVGGAQLDFLAHLHSEATDVLTECHSGALGSDTSARIQKH